MLSMLMRKAMNRSITNVLVGAFGCVSEADTWQRTGEMRERLEKFRGDENQVEDYPFPRSNL
jgi:NAD/NADP transhydrogenase beta subunit